MRRKNETGQIVLKHLSRDYDIDPYNLRQLLRREFGKHPRWRWDSESDPELKKIRKYLARKTGKSSPTVSKK